MNAILGIIRLQPESGSTDKDVQCITGAEHKFPSSFKDARKVMRPGLMIMGGFSVSFSFDDSVVVFYGHHFNHNELCMILGKTPAGFENDAELIHQLIKTEGIESAKKINGQFVIIFYDSVYKKATVINDHLGVQQIVYYQDQDMLLFASEVKFLLTHPACPRGIDWATAFRRPMPHIVLGSYKSYTTWFRGINLLPEACRMEIDLNTGTSSFSNYWKPQDTIPLADDKLTAQQLMDEYAALLEDAVRIRMQANGATHSLLSGGLDSSAICGLAVKHGPIETYSIVSQTTVLEDTTSFCSRMAEEMKFKNDQFLVPYRELCFNHHLWKQRVWRAESPVNHTDSLTKTLIHYAIRKHNPEVTNLLTGTGSDQMNGGLVGYIAEVTDDKAQTWDNFYNEILDVENRNLIGRDEESMWQLRKYINRDFLASVSGKETEANPWMIYVDGATHSEAYSLLWDEQRASASHGHATFYPFLDFRIAEFIAAVPGRFHQELFLDKQILREPSKQFLPDYIVNKPKMPYKLPEYDFRAELYEFLTQDNEHSLFTAAFGSLDTPHPVIDKKHLYSRILAMRRKPDIMEWLNIMHIINLGLLEQLYEQDENSLDYESTIDVPEKVTFDDPAKTKQQLEKRLGILSTDELLSKPVRFGENCSLLLDTKNNKYYLSRRNNLTYEIEDEYEQWRRFLMAVDNQLSCRQILDTLGIDFSVIEEFFRLCLKEQIFVTSDKSPGY